MSSTSPYRAPFPRRAWAPRFWGTWLLLATMWLLAHLPLVMSHAAGNLLGPLLLAANPKRRRVAMINLRLCFPGLTPAARWRLLLRHYCASAKGMLDLGYVWWRGPAWFDRRVRVRGREHLEAALAQGRRVILLTGHFAGMDLGGIVLSRLHPAVSIMKEIKNPLLNYFLWRGRVRFGGHLYVRAQGLKPVLRELRAGRMCYYIPDEDFGAREAVFAPFFGVAASTLGVLGRMAAITGAVVVPAFCRQRPWGRGYELILLPPLAPFPSGDVVRDTARMNAALEEGVRLMPAQYLWTLKLFRTRPPGEPDPYA